MPRIARTAFFLLFSLLLTAGSSAQQSDEQKPLRIEIPVKSDNETYRVLTCGESGAMLFFKSLETVNDTLSRWYFSYYDPDLKSKWVKAIPLPGILEFKSGIYRSDTLFLLFQPPDKEKKLDFVILRISLKNEIFTVNPCKMPKSARGTAFLTGFGKAVVGYQSAGNSCLIQFIDLATGNSKYSRITGDTTSTLSDLAIDTSAHEFQAVFRKEITRTASEFFFNRYDITGRKLSGVLVSTTSSDRVIRNLRIVPLEARQVLLLGTYGSRTKTSSKNDVTSESAGFYFSKVSPMQQESVSFINFLDLKNSSNLLGERDLMTLKKKALKKGRDAREYSVDFNILLHPVIRQDDQFLFLVETYYPEYHSENYTDFDFYGQPFINTYNVFDGYRFSNAIIAAFSADGKLLWDNTLEIRNLLSFQLDPKVQVYLAGKDIVLAYQSEGKIGSKIINGNNVVEKLDFSSLEMPSEGDKLVSETKSRLVSWYDDFFLSYGYEEIKNITEGNKRMVFYLTKIQFQ